MNAYENTLYVRTGDVAAVQRALDALFAEEQYARLESLPDRDAPGSTYHSQAKAARYWTVYAASFPSGWTLIQTTPAWLMCERVRDGEPRLLAKLAQTLGRDVFHVALVSKRGSVLLHEATPDGRTSTTGLGDRDPTDFRDEPVTNETYRGCSCSTPGMAW